MRFVFYEINNVFEINNGFVNSLVIENRDLFFRLLKDVSLAVEGIEGSAVLSKEHKPISFPKNVEILSDFINFDINNKSLITKITSALEKASLDEENYMETQRLMGEIEVQLSKWAFEFPCDIVPTKITPLSLIKSAGIELRNSYEGRFGEAEKLLDYMELVREFDCDKLFITVNMRAFFADDIVEKFIETVISNEIKLLMIENKSYSILKGEKRYTIDEDLCEF